MRKFIFSFILLLLFAGAVFYVGWIQILLPPGSYAVVHTKISGFDPVPIPSGTFVWRWERLLPTNLTLYPFTITPVVVEVPEIEGTLPSGEIYAAVVEGSPSFAYSIKLSLTVALRPESLPNLVENRGLTSENSFEWVRDRATEASAEVARQILIDPVGFLQGSATDSINRALAAKLPELEVLEVVPSRIQVPDYQLYDVARNKYLALTMANSDREVSVMADEAGTIRMLEEYGRLLNDYPVLLQYLYLQELKGQKIDGLDMNLEDILGRQ